MSMNNYQVIMIMYVDVPDGKHSHPKNNLFGVTVHTDINFYVIKI